MRLAVDSELKEYLDRLRQENVKAHLETWRQIAALEKRIDATVADNASAHAETRLHMDETVERLERQFELFSREPEPSAPSAAAHAPAKH